MWCPNKNEGLTIASLNTVFRRELIENEIFSGECHDFWEMLYVEEGSLNVAEDEQIFKMSKGQIIYHKPMEFHRFWLDEGMKAKIIVISFSLNGNQVDGLGNGVFNLSLDMVQTLFDIVEDFSKILDCSDYGIIPSVIEDSLHIQKISAKFLCFLIDNIKKAANSTYKLQSTAISNYKRIIRVLKDNIYEKLTVEDIAKLSLLGVSNLKKTFSAYAGCGVMSYFNSLKIIKATELLKESELSVAAISEKLGFTSPNYFSVVFKKGTGLLPLQYRKIHSTDIAEE